ncbi:UDP-glycosyltransferase 91A1-like [Malania oleifera]|uniref:UDP-glycosyltransferase 91A1-like n=1 Tax=Malania oleifera TaxID=397392 RepID=UPI0025ADA789|nr:UDP-glycosyltransferase 91A1-like [Malania oleifera]
MAGDELHVVMLPWSAFGHMIPFLQLSMALAKAGVRVSFVSTPRNIHRLPRPPPTLSPQIQMVELPLPALDYASHPLPEGAEATADVSFDQIQFLKVAYDLLKHPFRRFVADRSPDWIVVDFCSPWIADIAAEHRVPVIYFSVFSVTANVFAGPEGYLVGEGQRRLRSSPESLTSPPEWLTFPSSVAFRSHEARSFHAGFFGGNASGVTDAERLAETLSACQAVAARGCNEFAGEYLGLFEKLIGKRVIPVGLLPPEPANGRNRDHREGKWCEIFKWLDEQKPNSVLFVGFGSECKLNKDQIFEIAHGLELSELPFLWALRKPDWVTEDVDALPPGFVRRTSGGGVVCLGWAPQTEILGHPSIGGSLFHAGWGSAIEALQFGHCLVVLPFIIDQGLNARLLVEKGVAVEVERREDGSFSREDIAKSVRMAMASEEGKGVRERAREARKVFGDLQLHQDFYIAGFVEYLKNGVKKEQKPTVAP